MAPAKASGKRAKLWAGIKKGLSKLNCFQNRPKCHIAIAQSEKRGIETLGSEDGHETVTSGHNGAGVEGSEESDVLLWERVGDDIVVANRHGFAMLDSIDPLEKEVRELRRAQAAAEKRAAELEELLQTNVLEQASYYVSTRNKFVSTLKSRTTNETNDYDRMILADEQTAAATVPDAVSDALLFLPLIRLRRMDGWYYRDLYGMKPAEVLRVKGHLPTIKTLEAYAQVTISREAKPSSELRAHFLHFIHRLHDSDFNLTYLDGEITRVTVAYWEFRRALRHELSESTSSRRNGLTKKVRFSSSEDSSSTIGNCGEVIL